MPVWLVLRCFHPPPPATWPSLFQCTNVFWGLNSRSQGGTSARARRRQPVTGPVAMKETQIFFGGEVTLVLRNILCKIRQRAHRRHNQRMARLPTHSKLTLDTEHNSPPPSPR